MDSSTANPAAMAASGGYEGYEFNPASGATPDACWSSGTARRWPPLAQGGGQSWDMDQVGQEFIIRTYDPLYIVGSQTKWLLEDPTDPDIPFILGGSVGSVNSQGLFVFEGPYRARGDEDGGNKEATDRAAKEGKSKQVARVCWKAGSDGEVAADSDGFPRFVVMEWYPPRTYGIDWPQLTGSWGGWRVAPDGAIANTVLPLTVFEADAYKSSTENCEHIFHSVLTTTGSGTGFSGTASNPSIDFGANAPTIPVVLSADFLDIESSHYGCGVPYEMIGDTARLRTQLGSNNLLLAKAAFVGPVSSNKLLSTLIQPSGACMSLAGGVYSLFDPWTFVDFGDSHLDVVTLTPEDYAGQVGDPTSARATQELRDASPIDIVEVSARIDPTSGSFQKKLEQRSWDQGGQYRAQTITQKIEGNHLVHTLTADPGSEWYVDFQTRWRAGTKFWASQNFPISIVVNSTKGESIWPGQAVVITDEWLVNPGLSQYSLDFGIGYVTNRVFNSKTETVELTLLVSAAPIRYYAPALAVTRYDEDDEAEGYRLFCEDSLYRWNTENTGDFGAIRNIGLAGFQPPSWYSSAPIETDIEIFQFDGVSWTRGIYGTVSSISVGTFPVSIDDIRNPTGWLNLTGALTGNTYYRDMHHIVVLRRDGEQTAAWVGALYAPICDKDGTSDGTLGVKFI